ERNVSVSRLRKCSSPWVEKISVIGIFDFDEIISSVSNRGNPVFCSKAFPTTDLPIPIIPIRAIDLMRFTLQYQQGMAISKSPGVRRGQRTLERFEFRKWF